MGFGDVGGRWRPLEGGVWVRWEVEEMGSGGGGK